jgi:hypothetical protein
LFDLNDPPRRHLLDHGRQADARSGPVEIGLQADHAEPAGTEQPHWMRIDDGKITRIRLTFDPRAVVAS